MSRFGDRVTVAYEVRRIVAQHLDGAWQGYGSSGFLTWEDGLHGLPGLPLPEPTDLLDGGEDWRFLRRFKLGAPGIVVGFTWRTEGQRIPGSAGLSYYEDYEPATFHETRRVKVYQVALQPPESLTATRHPWPARIALAVPDDVEALR